MSVLLSPIGNGFNFLDVDGLPLAGGKINTYQAGSTTPFTTYTDVNGLIANTNPIILGTDGRPPAEIWLSAGFFYKFVLTDANDVVIQSYDNLYGAISTIPTVAPASLPTGCICCGLVQLDQFHLDLRCVMASMERLICATDLLLALDRPTQ